jgi:UDP-glucose 4-epimerase
MVFKLGLGRLGLPHLPPGAIDHLKYPIVVDSDAFTRATRFTYQHDERETINSFRTAR